MKGNNVLKEDRVASTIHIINGLMRGLTHQKQAKKANTDYFVFTGNTIDTVINMIQNRAAKDAVVVDDLGLQIVDRLYQEGLKNIILTRIPRENIAFVSELIKKTFPNINLDIKYIEEIDYMKTDLLISNPAYGAIGANITDTLRQKIDYKEFINLLPANDYKRNTMKDLFKYQSDMKPINGGFIDAAVTTHVARIHKGTVEDPAPNINMTLNEFERSQYIDPSLDKYFEENSKRTHYAIDATCAPSNYEAYKNKINVDTTFIVHTRDINHRYIPYKGKAYSVSWNINKIGTVEHLHERYWTMGGGRQSTYAFTTFNTAIERNNYTDFMLKNGWKFMCKIFKAINADGWVAASIWAPKVDWTRSWTVEEILKDYGYTEDEIKTVMADLDNFKGMDD